jgi:hypothetical protein
MDQTIIKRRLMARAAEVKGVPYNRQFQIDIISLMHDPQWSARAEAQDWRAYVDKEVCEVWASFSEQARIAIFINAETQASRE